MWQKDLDRWYFFCWFRIQIKCFHMKLFKVVLAVIVEVSNGSDHVCLFAKCKIAWQYSKSSLKYVLSRNLGVRSRNTCCHIVQDVIWCTSWRNRYDLTADSCNLQRDKNILTVGTFFVDLGYRQNVSLWNFSKQISQSYWTFPMIRIMFFIQEMQYCVTTL